MPDPFLLTLISVVVVATVATFLSRRSRDKCLKLFSNDIVTLEMTGAKTVWGRLRVEITGLEFVYASPHKDEDGHVETSFILYKPEYANMLALICYVDTLDEKGTERRARTLRSTYHPGVFKRLGRRILNVFNTLRDSVMEGADLLIGRAKKSTGIGTVLTSQDKYVSQLKSQIISGTGTAFEPLLERHIGKRVVVEMLRDGDILEYEGVLSDYTADFLGLMDVSFSLTKDDQPRCSDIVVPRKISVVRHLAE